METGREPYSRGQRLANRYKGCLRCEWCNRWTEVSMKRWQKLRSEDKLFPSKYIFFCARPRCKSERAEILDKPLPVDPVDSLLS